MSKFIKLIYTFVLMSIFTPFYAQDRTHNFINHEHMLDANATSKNVTITYLDGIGRPVRNVTNSQSTNGGYITSIQLYDECGRKNKNYFPIKCGNSPIFITNTEFISSSNSFYGENDAFEEKHYDVLNREISHFKGGEDWLTNEKQITKRYFTNLEPIKHYVLSPSGDGITEKESYPISSLYIEETLDEDDNKLAIYVDGMGKKVLERRAEDNDTYFVYDDLGHLRFVLSPNFQKDGDLLASTYEYKYNGKGKCIWKRLPGAQYIQYWYDKNDRLMYEQDGELRKKGIFRFFAYDSLGRLAIQGITSNMDERCTDATATLGKSPNFMQTGYILKNDFVTSGDIELVNYYDTYDFLQLPLLANLTTQANRDEPSNLPISLKTGIIRITSQGSVMPQIFYYNERGLVEEDYALYPNNIFMKKNYNYSFTGLPTEETVELNHNSKKYTYKLTNTYYPYNDKIKRIEIELPNKNRKLVAQYDYDEIGRLSSINRGQNIDCAHFKYNTRGSVTQILSDSFCENLYYTDSNLSVPCFNGNISCMTWQTSNDNVLRGYAFSYDNLNRLTTSMYGEEESLQSNKNHYSEIIQEYDANSTPLALKRYGKKNDGTYGLIDDLQLNIKGNQIISISDNAERLLYSGAFDFKQNSDKDYKYNVNGAIAFDPNKSLAIEYDNKGYPKNLNYENGNKTSFDYTPDGEKLSVTHLTGLPSTLFLTSDTSYISELSTLSSKTEYVGNFIFEQGHISKILFKDGYYHFSDSLCHYFVKDHLGSVRTVINEKGILEQVNNYYPFGGYISDACYNADLQYYKYNGKELQRMHGLDCYDYGERFYDGVLSRWDRIDNLCEQYYHISPYAYCISNPLRYIDKFGLRPGDFFPSADAAALDFGICYNRKSILENREYGASIFVITNKKGQKGYTYSVPNRGEQESVYRSDAPLGKKTEASVHTHAASRDGLIEQMYDNEFSGVRKQEDNKVMAAKDLKKIKDFSDIGNANRLKINAYVATPDGTLQKYNYQTGKITTISTSLPSDVNSIYRINNNITTSFSKDLYITDFLNDFKRIMYEQY